jgi:uncharacterized protein with FMN-binding domain
VPVPSVKKAPLVISATAVGFAAVMAFHPKGTALSPSALTSTGTKSASVGSSSTSSSTVPSSGTTSTTVPPVSTTTAGSRTVTGASVNYQYGILSVSITVSGHRITKVGIASLNDGGSFRSQSIDQQSIPILEQEALAAQSANIQGVSGASYTSEGFVQSLQSALSKAGL